MLAFNTQKTERTLLLDQWTLATSAECTSHSILSNIDTILGGFKQPIGAYFECPQSRKKYMSISLYEMHQNYIFLLGSHTIDGIWSFRQAICKLATFWWCPAPAESICTSCRSASKSTRITSSWTSEKHFSPNSFHSAY